MFILEDLVIYISEFSYLKQQIDILLRACTSRIKELILMMKQLDIEDTNEIFIELFEIQRTLSTMKNKYLFEFDNFLNDFIYFFDRQDEYNKKYLHNHFQRYNHFPD